MKKLTVETTNEYPIYIGQDIFKKFSEHCLSLKKRFAVITDNNIKELYGEKILNLLHSQQIQAELFSFPSGEEYKTRETKQFLEDRLFEKKFTRNDTCFIALGGGVVTDLTGFLAATFCRGVPVIYVPTTLLAMVDASIGGKTSVNTPHGKNLLGTFTQPQSVWMDIDFLATLPKKEWHNGTIEMLKHGLIANQDIFRELKVRLSELQKNPQFLTDMIYESCLIKKNIVEQDECEQGMRQLLNFGHTIGHAIETIENYKNSHGEAVALGIMTESYMAYKLGILDEATFNDIHHTFNQFEFTSNAFAQTESFHEILTLDKKSIAKIPRFILLNQIGKPFVSNHKFSHAVDEEVLKHSIQWAREQFVC